MGRTTLTVSIDAEIKKRAMDLINSNERKGFASELVENSFKYYIAKKEGVKDEFIEKEKRREVFEGTVC